MQATYNPIVRMFGRFRAGLVDSLGVARQEVHPGTTLESILPVETRRKVWRRLRARGVPVPELELPPRESSRQILEVLRTTASIALWLRRWLALLLVVPLGMLAYRVSRHWAIHFPLGVRTVGDMVLLMTR